MRPTDSRRMLSHCASSRSSPPPWGISGNIMMGFWCRLDGDDDSIHLDNFELADGAWVSRKELQETFVNNGIALTAEMISEFAAGRDPYSLEAKS